MKSLYSGLVLSLLAAPLLASASGNAEWAAGDKALRSACLKQSQLKQAKAVGDIMLFDDSVGYSALVLEGRYPQAYMHNKTGRELCLYQRATGKALITEADGLLPARTNK